MSSKNYKKEKDSKKSNEDVLETAKKRFDLAVEAEADIRKEALDDLKFRAGDQWDDQIKNQRELENRPCLTINRLPQFIRQVTNDQRQNRPSIKVSPVDDQADIETAKVLQGIIRHIEYNSNADAAYDTAFEGCATKGLGYFRITTDYVSPTSFEQEILIKRIKESFSVYLDPYYQEPDGSDANWGFIFEDVNWDDYKAQYGDSEMASKTECSSIGDQAPSWANEETCRVAEYFYKEFEKETIAQLSDGSVSLKKDLPQAPEMLPDGLKVIAERETVIPKIKWCKINAVEILEETDWPGLWIPIVPVLGDELVIEGKRILEGIVRHAKDPQKMYNYWATSETETIALAPRAPFIGAEGQFEGHEEVWKTANTKSHAYLEYKPTTIAGQIAPAPQRNVIEPPVMAITNARVQSSEDLKATTGIYDAALGNRSNESSGIAIQRRNVQAQTSNFHYIDNLTRSLRHAGRILVDLIPKIYDTPRVQRIIGEDGEEEMIRINEIFEHKGKPTLFQLGKGKYDVTVSTGPSYATKRQEAVDSMLSLTQSYPKVAEVAGDLMVKNMDWPGANDVAERLKKTIPPELLDQEGEQDIPPQIKQQMMQMNQVIEQMTQALNEANEKVNNKTLELESKERIEFAKMELDYKKEMAKLDSSEALEAFRAEVAQINQRLDLVGIDEPVNSGKQNFNGTGPQGTAMPNDLQPTGGNSPGLPVE